MKSTTTRASGTRISFLCLATLLTAALGCARGAPPGFSSGDTWTFPLVGPLENDVLLVPVMIHDQGPFLFRLDPDAQRSVVEREIAEQANLAMGAGPRLIDETDTGRQTYVAEVRVMKIGTLTVEKKFLTLVKAGTFDTATRRVVGVIGRDVIADSLTLGIDRDRGIAVLTTQEAFVAPSGATSFKYDLVSSKLDTNVRPVGRRVIEPTIGGSKLGLHLDFGQYVSELDSKKWASAQLANVPQRVTLVDEVGTSRTVDLAGIAPKVAFGGVEAFGVSFVPYADKRWDYNVADGKLGLGAFRDFTVWVNWDKARVYLTPRTPTPAIAAERIKRWGWQELASCGDAACIQFEQIPAASPTEGAKLKITRAAAVASAGMELALEITSPSQMRFVVTFMPGATEYVMALPAPAAPNPDMPAPVDNMQHPSVAPTVLDISPFHRVCARSAPSCGIELP